jgi:hypothetical protein
VPQSALSYAVRGLEARFGLRLLGRTSVAPTEAGERLLATVSYGPNSARFVQLKRRYDPHNLFRSATGLPRLTQTRTPWLAGYHQVNGDGMED